MNALRLLALSLLLSGCASLGGSPPPGEALFARVQQGMTRADTHRLLGTPDESMRFGRTGTESWDYEFRDPWNYLAAFSVIFGPQGTVIGTMTSRLRDGGDLGQ